RSPVIALIDRSTRATESIADFDISALRGDKEYELDAIIIDCDESLARMSLNFKSRLDARALPPLIYQVTDSGWEHVPIGSMGRASATRGARQPYVDEAFDRPPVLAVRNHGERVLIWDPNPQLSDIAPQSALLYRWHDKGGYAWSGILLLPPH